MASTVSGVLLTGVHGSRPSSGVTAGTLYACSTHSLIYQTSDTGSTWATWATLTGTGLTDPMTTRGDIIVRDAANATSRLARGTAGKFLTSDGTDVAYGQGPLTTTGDLLIGATGGTPTRLAAGATSGHVLTSNGAGAAPSYQAGGGGGFVFLEAHTASSSATLDFTTAISATYDEYVIWLVNIVPATNGDSIYLRMGTGGGPTYDSTAGHYAYESSRWTSAASATGGSASTTFIGIDGGAGAEGVSSTASNGGLSGVYRVFNPGGGAANTFVRGDTTYWGSVNATAVMGATAGAFLQTTAVTALRVLASTGNIASGVVRVYGVVKS